jgi:mannitol operon transcriptional antiterminator
MLKERSALIVKILLEKNSSPLTVNQLSKKLNVSARSIRYDLEEIEDWLKSKQLTMNRKPKIGIWIDGDEVLKNQALSEFGEVEHHHYYSKDQRMKLILFILLSKKEPTIIKEFEIDLKVSESTVLRDLEQLEENLTLSDLKLNRKPNTGVWIDGREWEKRILFYHLIHEELNEQRLSLENLSFNKLLYLLSDQLKFLLSIMNKKYPSLIGILRDSDLHLTKASIYSLLIQLLIVLVRNEQEERLSAAKLDMKSLKNRPEFTLANRLMDDLTESGITIHENEAYFITVHLLSSRSNYTSTLSIQDSIGDQDLKKNLQSVVLKMVRVIEQFLGFSFKEDSLLIKGLVTHLEPMIYRLQYKIPVEKPDTSNLEENYPGIYTAAAAGVHVIEEVFRLVVPSDEIAYLAFYIGAAIERQKSSNTEKIWNVLLVCDTGFGTAQLLKERVQSVFPNFHIKGTCAMNKIHQYKDGIDLCLATVPIHNENIGIPVIETSPLLNFLDVTNIQNFVQNQHDHYRDTVNDLAEKIIKKATSLGFYHPDFKEEVKRILSGENPSISDKKLCIRKERQKLLAELLTTQTVSVIDEIGTWEDAVKKAGDLLEEAGSIEASYTEAMLQSIFKHGPYIVIAPGIALLHARPEDGVKEVCMSLQVVRNGVKFGHKDRDPVDLVFAFGAMDTQSHLLALSQLMNLFNNQELLQELRKSNRVDEAIEVIRQIKKPEKVRK